MARALALLINESLTIIGVQATSTPWFRTSARKGNCALVEMCGWVRGGVEVKLQYH